MPAEDLSRVCCKYGGLNNRWPPVCNRSGEPWSGQASGGAKSASRVARPPVGFSDRCDRQHRQPPTLPGSGESPPLPLMARQGPRAARTRRCASLFRWLRRQRLPRDRRHRLELGTAIRRPGRHRVQLRLQESFDACDSFRDPCHQVGQSPEIIVLLLGEPVKTRVQQPEVLALLLGVLVDLGSEPPEAAEDDPGQGEQRDCQSGQSCDLVRTHSRIVAQVRNHAAARRRRRHQPFFRSPTEAHSG